MAADPNRTIQIDALTDVQLSELESPSAAPPPLPRRQVQPSRVRVILLTALASLAGLVLAMIAVHFLFPAPPSAPPVHRVQLDEEVVIHASH